ncbi:MAG TPA: gephyrin-like molybdotransferase Glp [Caulobacterales bacterium]|nr:gephyrin-like molybdotransferase Glp [Caulobacterales bacterium]
MISVAEARASILAHVGRTAIEDLPLEDCLGRTLAAPVIAKRDQPPFAASAMDGYAVRSADTPGLLKLVGEAGAGHAFGGALKAGACARIFTGAPLPAGADAIAIQEDVTRQGDVVAVPLVTAGAFVRPAGLDFAAGATLLRSGVVLAGGDLALAAATGRDRLCVATPPRIIIVSGGDEIVAPGAEAGPDQIYDSASFGVAGLAQAWGAASHRGAVLRDDAALITAALEEALPRSDLVVVIGGASVGEHDHARKAAQVLGATILFDKVSLRPGKPTWFALRGAHRILGVPGNPASALVCARLFLRPVIAAMLGGDAAATVRPRRARLSAPLPPNNAREAYLRAAATVDDEGQLLVAPAPDQDSSLVSVFSAADALIIRPGDCAASEAGDLVDTLSI